MKEKEGEKTQQRNKTLLDLYERWCECTTDKNKTL